MTEKLNSKSFAEHVNSEFKVQGPNAQTLLLRLAQVSESDSNPRVEQFSLFFHGPREPLLEQRIYRLAHEKLGELDLFLVPVGVEPEGALYECAFNRLRKAETRTG
jgi:hypothetical protein